MTASKANKDLQRVYDGSLLEEIKQDNAEAARKQQSKKRIGVTNKKLKSIPSAANDSFRDSISKDLEAYIIISKFTSYYLLARFKDNLLTRCNM